MTYQDFITGKPFTVNGIWKDSIFRFSGDCIESKPINSIENWAFYCYCPNIGYEGFTVKTYGLRASYQELFEYTDLTLYKP